MAEPVLVVEDDPDVREVMVAVVESEGHTAVAAENGDEALKILRGGLQPCLILLDLMMPVKDGWEFRAEQEADPNLASIPVIVVSAAQKHQVESLHAAATLPKPIDFDRLTSLLKQHCITNHRYV
jgi:CheY-like chemotaxis protein